MPPVSCPDIDSCSHNCLRNLQSSPTTSIKHKSLYNFIMSILRWLFFALSIAIGLGLGLYYGWVISPVEYVDTTPSTLRADYRADYTLMVAETYQHDHNIENAARHLAILGGESPAQIAISAQNFAQLNNFDQADIALLQTLRAALQARQPEGAIPTVEPTGSKP